MRLLILFFAFFSIPIPQVHAETEKSVLIAILASNHENTLPDYLKCLDELDYPKKSITIYVNSDQSEMLLREWVTKHKRDYRKIIFKENDQSQTIGDIRNESLKQALREKSDYYFLINCGNFIAPATLKKLIAADKPIVAPMLRSIPYRGDVFSNYFFAITDSGYYKHDPLYYQILDKTIKGVVEVPVVHSTYLVKRDVLDQLSYTDGSDDHAFVIFSRIARARGIAQYICNDEEFGTVLHVPDTSNEQVFSQIYRDALWGRNCEGHGYSGEGSLASNAIPYMEYLQGFIEENEIQSVVDLGCGDWEFSQHIDWKKVEYTGFDVVEEVIQRNIGKFEAPNIQFKCADATQVDLPSADLLICKDVLQHLPHKDIHAIAAQFNKFKYCIITNDVSMETCTSPNDDLSNPGGYRTLDLTKPPFNFKVEKVFTYVAHQDCRKQVILLSSPSS